MLAPLLIMFREGVEAALIVGIIASYLRQTGRKSLMKYVWFGVISAALLCLFAGILLQATSEDFLSNNRSYFQELWP